MTRAADRRNAWVLETQMHQRIARNGAPADSYEALAEQYDADQAADAARKLARKVGRK